MVGDWVLKMVAEWAAQLGLLAVMTADKKESQMAESMAVQKVGKTVDTRVDYLVG